MLLYPKLYCKKITDIKIEFLIGNNIKGLILDVDNTLIDFNLNMIDGLENWHENIVKSGIKTIIVSNTNKENKIKKVSNILKIDYIMFAMKPLKKGFIKAKTKLNLSEENIAVIGDQIFTDIIGANRCKMFPILVEPIDKKDIWITRFKRPIEKFIIKKYIETKEVK
ncbi:MAG: YqeG family HAD IIIA-type phosphatase [Candidatus Scatovivens sp.]